jgi:hypothetical protein
MGGEEVYLDTQSILEHYRVKTGNPSDLPKFSESPEMIQKTVQTLLNRYKLRRNSNWERNITERNAPALWRLREWVFTQVLLSMPEDPSVTLHMFGSTKPTSDIDITVEAKSASDFIRLVEKQWTLLTGTSTTQWAVEFYGDFLMFYDAQGEKTFINTRRFDEEHDKEVLVYVGLSILRNAGTFDFPELDEMLRRYPSLQKTSWRSDAQELYKEYKTLSDDQKREAYYKYLKEAESLRDTQSLPEEKTKAIFLALCRANMYRNENYILPSTVIHVVRDLQAESPRPQKNKCSVFKVKLASCALGSFTYLCSALEQLGYMHKYENTPSKYKKYYVRFRDAMNHLVDTNISNQEDSFKGNFYPIRSSSPFAEDPYNGNFSPMRSNSPFAEDPIVGGRRKSQRKTQRKKRKYPSKRRHSKTRK